MDVRARQTASATATAVLMLWLTASAPASAQLNFDDRGGNFAAPVDYTVGTNPYAVVAADFNADGRLDLAVSNEDSDNISVLLGSGGGAFSSSLTFAAGDGPQGLATADINSDGNLDLVAPNVLSNNVSVLLGTGTGSFSTATHFAVGAFPHQVAIAHLNGDGFLDLATANGGGVSVLLGTGTGSFGAPIAFAAGFSPRDVKARDLNTDGNLDLIVVNEGGASVSILLGNGAGSFSAPTQFTVGVRPLAASVADFNSDGRSDLAVVSIDDQKVSILLGTGTGAFTAGSQIVIGARGQGLTALDMDGDGHQDLVTVDGALRVTIFLGSGAGAFGPGTAFETFGGVHGVLAAHLNPDTKPDIVLVKSPDARVGVLLNISEPPLNITPSAGVDRTGSYTLRKVPIWINWQTVISPTYPPLYPFSHAGYADIDLDGDTDFLRTFGNNNDRFDVQIMINGGSGVFTDQTSSRIVGVQPGLLTPNKVLTGDYNSDGWPDFFVVANGIDFPPFPGEYPQAFLSNGNGTLRYAPGLEAEIRFWEGGTSADIDGNGTVDILLGGNASPRFLLNDGLGNFTKNTFRLPRMTDVAGGPLILFNTAEMVDVDADGFIDLVLNGYEQGGIPNVIYWGSSTGLYRDRNRTRLPPVADMGITLDFAIEDIDRDGRKDLMVNRTGGTNTNYVGRTIQILRQIAPRQFVDETSTRMIMNRQQPPIDRIRAQDIDGNGSVDLFIDDRNNIGYGEYAWTNNGQGVFTPYFGPVNPSIATFANGFE